MNKIIKRNKKQANKTQYSMKHFISQSRIINWRKCKNQLHLLINIWSLNDIHDKTGQPTSKHANE